MWLKHLWAKLRHPRAIGKFRPDVLKIMGLATGIASQCKDPLVRPIHVLYALLAIEPANTHDNDWLADEQRRALLDLLTNQLAPDRETLPKYVPPSDALKQLAQAMVAPCQSGDQFFVVISDVRRELAKLCDPEVDTFIRDHDVPLAPQ